jgi:hypothetical protein
MSPFGKITAGEKNGREITDGTERIAERESDGAGKAGTDDHTGGVDRAESELPAGAADICGL